jgi:hypothetical protein
MLDAFIIEEIRKRERDREKEDERPQPQIPVPERNRPSRDTPPPEKPDRGVVIIDYSTDPD